MRAIDASVNVPLPSPGARGVPGQAPRVRDAATVILVSDRPDLHVLMMERTRRAVFGPGATVFPGGAVDADDCDERAYARIVGLDDREASAAQGLPSGGLGFRMAAARECFEEAGIILARDAMNGQLAAHDAALEAERDRLNAGTLSFVDLLESRSLVLAAKELRLFSHWLTPVGAPRRYNTWFFVAPAPEGEDGAHDNNELVASGWVRPADALAQHRADEIDLIFPTEMSLRVLANYTCAADVFADLDAVPRDARGGLHVVGEGNGQRVALAADAGAEIGAWTIPLPDVSFRSERAFLHEVGE